MRLVVAASVVLLLAGSAHAADEVTIHVTGDAGGVLEQQMYEGTGKRWAPLCTSPCVAKAPRDGWFRIGSPPGKDVTPSNPFGIESKDAKDVTFDVDVATSSNRRTGSSSGRSEP